MEQKMVQLWRSIQSVVQGFKIMTSSQRTPRADVDESGRFREIERRKCRRRFFAGCSSRRRAGRYNKLKKDPSWRRGNFGCGISSSRSSLPLSPSLSSSALLFSAHLPSYEEISPEVESMEWGSHVVDLESFAEFQTEPMSMTTVGKEPFMESSSNLWEDQSSTWTGSIGYTTNRMRGKLKTLHSLMRTLSDRYARRIGRLTAKGGLREQQPPLEAEVMLAKATWGRNKSNLSNETATAGDVIDSDLLKRYENPFQEFLSRSAVVQRRFSRMSTSQEAPLEHNSTNTEKRYWTIT